MMKLYQAPASPFARKVLVVLHETGQFDDVEHVVVTTTAVATDPSLALANPLGKIPALERRDGPTLYDSRVLCRFFNDRAGARLYPEHHIWETLTLEATGDGIMEAAVLMVYENRLRPPERRFEPWVEAQWGKIHRTLDALEERWMSHLHGPLDVGQIAVGCALGYLDFRHGDRNWRKGRDALAAWERRFAERESMKRTVPSG